MRLVAFSPANILRACGNSHATIIRQSRGNPRWIASLRTVRSSPCSIACARTEIQSSIPPEEIAAKIAVAEKRKRETRARLVGCPGCSCQNLTGPQLFKHMQRCCPDLICNVEEWGRVMTSASLDDMRHVHDLLHVAQAEERELHVRAIKLAFHQTDQEGRPIKQGPAELSQHLALPTTRCARILKNAIKNTKLPGDEEAVDILYEDDAIIVVDKPPFLRSQPIHRHVGGSMVNRLITYLGKPPKVVHRLDMNTSGVLLFAKDAAVVPALHAQFRRHHIKKKYIAVAIGRPGMKHYSVEEPLDRHPTVAAAGCVTANGKRSLTHIDVTSVASSDPLPHHKLGTLCTLSSPARCDSVCVAVCQPQTGRTHQIRLHLAHIGHPIIGDDFYGVVTPMINRQALHAWTLSLEHPINKRRLFFCAPLPSDMRDLIAQYGLQEPSSSELNLL